MASRIPGVTPSDVAIVALFLHKRDREDVGIRTPRASNAP
jgi:hypothetical protein